MQNWISTAMHIAGLEWVPMLLTRAGRDGCQPWKSSPSMTTADKGKLQPAIGHGMRFIADPIPEQKS
jgi:hypothetical protein